MLGPPIKASRHAKSEAARQAGEQSTAQLLSLLLKATEQLREGVAAGRQCRKGRGPPKAPIVAAAALKREALRHDAAERHFEAVVRGGREGGRREGAVTDALARAEGVGRDNRWPRGELPVKEKAPPAAPPG